ncbi:MAG: Mov34/MPN/PAD-1 family protein [Sedimentisphaerales bacterium]
MFQLGQHQIFISNNVFAILELYKQSQKTQKEAGGILLGQVRGKQIFVLKASIPNKYDKSRKFNYMRDKDVAQVIVNHEFANSTNKTIYLGEWHTHPEIEPWPSICDLRMIDKQYFGNRLNEKFIVIIIKGTEKLFVGLYDGKVLSHIIIDSTIITDGGE